jgi:hypothetical protein
VKKLNLVLLLNLTLHNIAHATPCFSHVISKLNLPMLVYKLIRYVIDFISMPLLLWFCNLLGNTISFYCKLCIYEQMDVFFQTKINCALSSLRVTISSSLAIKNTNSWRYIWVKFYSLPNIYYKLKANKQTSKT